MALLSGGANFFYTFFRKRPISSSPAAMGWEAQNVSHCYLAYYPVQSDYVRGKPPESKIIKEDER